MTISDTDLDDYYEMFDIDRAADGASVEQSLRTARRRWRQQTGSPDRKRAQLAERRMADLETAERVLLDEGARAEYDASLDARRSADSLASAPSVTEDWAVRAEEYYSGGDLRNAFTAAKKGTDIDPGNVAAWQYYVRAATDLRRYDDADFASAELVRRAPSDASSHELRGEVLEARDRFAEAEREFRAAARIAPDGVYYHGRAAWAALDDGRIDAAVTEARKLLERFPGDEFPMKVLRAAATALCDRKQPQRALQVAQKLIPLDPSEENVLAAIIAIQDIATQVSADTALTEATRLLDAFPERAAAQKLMRFVIIELRQRDRDADALLASRALLERYPQDEGARREFALSRLSEAESQMSATGPQSHIIVNKAQAAYYGAAVAEVAALRVDDPDAKRALESMRTYHATQVRTRVRLSFWRVVLAILAAVLVIVGLSALPSGLLWIIIGGLLGWLFVALSFPKQYRLNAKGVSQDIRRQGLQR